MHKLICIIFLTVAISTLSQAQNSKWRAGMSIMPEYSIPATTDELVETENQFGFTLQAVISYTVQPKLEILSGLAYELNRIHMIDYTLTIICDFGAEGIYHGLKNEVQLHYLGIPLHAKFNFSKEGNSGFVRLGYNQFFKVGESIATSFLQECNDQDLIIKIEREPVGLSGEIEIGIGIEIESPGHSSLLLEAVAGYAINGAFKEHRILKNVRMWDLGLRIGVLFGGS